MGHGISMAERAERERPEMRERGTYLRRRATEGSGTRSGLGTATGTAAAVNTGGLALGVSMDGSWSGGIEPRRKNSGEGGGWKTGSPPAAG
jgi:hypothetical protein